MDREIIKFLKSKTLRARALKGFVAFLILMIAFTLISRAADAMTIPLISTDKIQKGTIDRTISASGSVVQNEEQAVITLAGIRVKKINVKEGQIINKGDTLFELDMDDLKDQITALKQEIEVMDLEASDAEYNASLTQNDKQKQINRANEDYNDALKSSNKEVSNAYEAMIDAENELKNYQNSSNGSGEQLQSAYNQAEQQLEQAKSDLQDLNNKVEKEITDEQEKAKNDSEGELTQAQLDEIENTVRNTYQSQLASAENDVSAAQAERDQALVALNQNSNYDETEKALQNAYNQAKQAYETAVANQESTLKSQNRNIQDANSASQVDSSNITKEMSRETKVRELEKLEALEKENGMITSPIDALVSQSALSLGSATPDGMAMILADLSSGSRFVAQITAEEQKLLSREDLVSVKTNDNKTIKDLTIDAIQQSKENTDLYDVTVILPDGEMEVGSAGTLEFTKKSSSYNQRIPLEALMGGENDYYVLALVEKDSILGSELSVEKISVTVIEKNEKYAAIQEGSLIPDQEFVISATREVQSGDRVRRLEE